MQRSDLRLCGVICRQVNKIDKFALPLVKDNWRLNHFFSTLTPIYGMVVPALSIRIEAKKEIMFEKFICRPEMRCYGPSDSDLTENHTLMSCHFLVLRIIYFWLQFSCVCRVKLYFQRNFIQKFVTRKTIPKAFLKKRQQLFSSSAGAPYPLCHLKEESLGLWANRLGVQEWREVTKENWSNFLLFLACPTLSCSFHVVLFLFLSNEYD